MAVHTRYGRLSHNVYAKSPAGYVKSVSISTPRAEHQDSNMKRLRYRPGSVCQLCEFISQAKCHSQFTRPYASLLRHQRKSQKQLTPPFASGEGARQVNDSSHLAISNKTPQSTQKSAAKHLSAIKKEIEGIVNRKTETLVPENDTLEALQALENFAQATLGAPVVENKDGATPASALLTLDPNTSQAAVEETPPLEQIPSRYREAVAREISKLAQDIIRHPGIFITPTILQTYVSVQALIGHPETLPEAFTLYANKPIPRPNTSPIQYKTPSPNKASSAITASIASLALTAAIEKKDLSLALAIIDTTICTPAFHRSKIIRRALPLIVGGALAPVAVYTVASQLSVYQDSMDTAMATNVAFAGILAYVGFTATIGLVAVTTANDQMDRVTWATGMPLRERWLREEERAALDRVAGAWGFRETFRRGEEEGREWEELREWIGRRGMVLDRVELMEGME